MSPTRELEPTPRRGLHPLEVVAYVIVVLAGMRAAAGLVNPILLAALLALICVPPMQWLQRHRVPERLSVALTVLGALLLILGVTAVIGTSISQFNDSRELYEAELGTLLEGYIEDLRGFGLPLPDIDKFMMDLDASKILGLVGETMSGLVGLLSNVFVIGLLVVFILFEASGMARKLHRIHGGQSSDLSQYQRVMRNVSDYVAVASFVSFLTGLCIGVTMWALDVKFPVLWGVIAFAFNFIPNIGSLIAAIPGVLFALVDRSPGTALAVALAYLVVNFLIGNVLEPRMLGNRLGLSTLVVFVSLLVWAWVLGPVGMLIAAPLTAIIKIALENSHDLRALAVLLGPADEVMPDDGASEEG